MPNKVLKKLPDSKNNVNKSLNSSNVSEAVIQHLKENRHGTKTKRGRKQKLNIQPGKSISYEELLQANNVPVAEVVATNSDKATNSKQKVVRKVKPMKQRKWVVLDASESDTDVSTVASFHDSSDDDILSELEDTNDLEKESIVKVVTGNYKDYYAEVIGTSYGDEVEVQYLEKIPEAGTRNSSNCHYRKIPNDYDSREKEEYQKVMEKKKRCVQRGRKDIHFVKIIE